MSDHDLILAFLSDGPRTSKEIGLKATERRRSVHWARHRLIELVDSGHVVEVRTGCGPRMWKAV